MRGDLYICGFRRLPAEVVFTDAILFSILHKCIVTVVQEKVRIPMKARLPKPCLTHFPSVFVAILVITVFWSYKKTMLI